LILIVNFVNFQKDVSPKACCIFGFSSHHHIKFSSHFQIWCRNPSFGLTTKEKGLQGCGPRGSPRVKARGSPGVKARRSPGVTSHTPGSVRSAREYEGVNLGSMRKWTLTLPRQLPLWEMDSWWTPETSESHFRGQN